MTSDEKKLEPINDTLNPEPSRFGMPWYVILGILSLSVFVFLLPGCKIFGASLCPSVLGFGWWLTKDDPKEPQPFFMTSSYLRSSTQANDPFIADKTLYSLDS